MAAPLTAAASRVEHQGQYSRVGGWWAAGAPLPPTLAQCVAQPGRQFQTAGTAAADDDAVRAGARFGLGGGFHR